MNTAKEILDLIGIAAQELQVILSPNSDVAKGVKLSADFLQAIKAVMSRHAANSGMTIDEVLKTL
jgi:hypothetical protein